MRRDDAWLYDMLDSAQLIAGYPRGVSLAQFKAATMMQDTVVHRLTVIGEAAKNISGDLRDERPDVAWSSLAGLRDVIVHRYFRMDVEQLWDEVHAGVPPLVATLRALLSERGQPLP